MRSCNTLISEKPIARLLLVMPMLISCSDKPETDFLVVSGRDFEYHIPSKLERKPDAILYPGELSGDQHRVISLSITQDDIKAPDLGNTWELTWLLFWDRDYQKSGGLRNVLHTQLSDVNRIESSNEFYRFQKKLGNTQTDYYLSFNPTRSSPADLNDEYMVEVSRHPPFVIGNIETASKPRCILHTIYDSMAMQVSTVGMLCNQDRFGSLFQVLKASMISWKVSKQSSD